MLGKLSDCAHPNPHGEKRSPEIPYVSWDEPLMELSAKIATETNPKTIAALISELIRLLAEEQNAIKEKIRANLSITPPS